MGPETYLVAAATFALSLSLTFVIRKFALARGLLDVPNERSSHNVPTARGGGAAIVAASMAAFIALGLLRVLEFRLLFALAGGGLAVAIVGYVDDRHPLPARTRLAVHAATALWALAWLGGLPPMRVGGDVVSFGGVGYALGVLGIVWVLNLFNFMDGIDGIAASEAMFITWGGALLAIETAAASSVPSVAFVFGAACAGFLIWNWPPAKLFMGDIGSGYLGYVIAVLAIAAARDNPVALLVWLALGGIFFVDATVTLVRRLARGERANAAHRSHAYQWLARRWRSHRRVTVTVAVVNLVWLLPCAWLSSTLPYHAAWIVLGGLIPVVAFAIAAGAGRKEDASRRS